MTAGSEALLLGALHGPLELLPVSSSAHVAAIPAALKWDVAGWTGAERKELEVALHAGTAAALGWLLLRGRLPVAGLYAPRGLPVLAAAVGPPALAGVVLEEVVEERLRGPVALAAGLLAGAAALALGDARPGARSSQTPHWRDGAWIGLAQTAALVPGVSRSGASLAAARARGFERPRASELSWGAGLPVLLGAAALKGRRVATGGTWRERGVPLGAAAGAACASTLVAAELFGAVREGPLWRWSAWRAGLAAFVLAVRENATGD